MAALALEKIRQAPESKQIDVSIFIDSSTDRVLEEFEYVRDEYFPEATIYHARQHISAPSGCWNILQSLQQGYLSGAERIFLIEEDVMVYPTFFKWSFEAHDANPGCFATCGRLRKEHSSDYYTNPGACFKSESLRRIVPYITDSYFKSRRPFLDQEFGPMDEASDLDDGLIRRVIRKLGAKILYPQTPKCAHQGFHFYNRTTEFKTEGSIEEKISQLRSLLEKLSPDGRYSKDFEPYRPLN